MARDSRLDLEQFTLINRARVLGETTAIPIILDDVELSKVASVVLLDNNRADLIPEHLKSSSITSFSDAGGEHCEFSLKWFEEPGRQIDYYDIPLGWFEAPGRPIDFTELFLTCTREIRDFSTYFKCLCELHKRRKKYSRILTAQPLPTMLQVAPRSLLEFGVIPSPALASWIVWRKWFFDIDNRAGQETGYLFEPILASALGGSPYGARNSPVKRSNNTTKGRQVDCIVGKTAYEFKLRVTIAASGQGRFQEELDFAHDCKNSNFKPVLIVLDPTPSHRLTDLIAEYKNVGGEAYIGDEAWRHLEEEAGKTMAKFIEQYVRKPIVELDNHCSKLLDLSIKSEDDESFQVVLGDDKDPERYVWDIPRSVDITLSEDSGNGSEAA
jgi:hypothetical protein